MRLLPFSPRSDTLRAKMTISQLALNDSTDYKPLALKGFKGI